MTLFTPLAGYGRSCGPLGWNSLNSAGVAATGAASDNAPMRVVFQWTKRRS